MSDGSGNGGILSAAAASFQLLPTLLGFRIPLTASDAAVPLPSPMPASRQVPPRDAKLSYKGAMLNGLQASRNLHSAQPPGGCACRARGGSQTRVHQVRPCCLDIPQRSAPSLVTVSCCQQRLLVYSQSCKITVQAVSYIMALLWCC